MTSHGSGARSRVERDDPDRHRIPAPVAGESALLQRIRRHVDLRVMVGATRRGVCFANSFSALIVTLRLQISDVLFSFLRSSTAGDARTRHKDIIEGIAIMLDTCSHVQDLAAWDYSDEQRATVQSRFSVLAGWGRRLQSINIRRLTDANPLTRVADGGQQQQITVSGGATVSGVNTVSGNASTSSSTNGSRGAGSSATAEEPRAVHDPGGTHAVVEFPFLLALLFALQSARFPLLPLAFTLAEAARGYWSQDLRTFTVDRSRHVGFDVGWEWLVLTENLPSFGVVAVYFMGSAITRFVFLHPWPLVQVHSGKGFLPEACRIPLIPRRPFAPDRKLLAVRDRDASYLSLALEDWEQVMGTLSAELRIVLEGRFAISREELPLVQVVYRNHPSWEDNPEAQKALWPVLAQYLLIGQFEYVKPGDPLPIAILPIGAVPKSTPPWWRLILDCRYSNKFIDPWPVRYLSLAGLSLLLSRNSFFCVEDIQAAYLLTRLGGCGRRPVKVKRFKHSECQNGYVEWEGEMTGCSPSDCGRLCDKSALGFAAAGHVMRAACTPFGMAVSHGTLTIITNAVQQYVVRRWGHQMGVFVDDLILVVAVIVHALCAGYLGGCPICAAAFPAAQQSQKAFEALLDRLHLEQSDKRIPMAQLGVYLGIHIDTHQGLYTLTEKKVAKLVRDLEEVLGVVVMTPRECSKVRGKLANYSFCMQRIKPFIQPFNAFIGGPRNNREWDAPKHITAEMMDVAAFLLRHLAKLVQLGAPIWPIQASTLHDRFMRRALPAALQDNVVVLTHDAAESGVGCAHRVSPDGILHYAGKRYPALTSVLTFGDDIDVQVRREALGGWMNLDLYQQQHGIDGKHIIIRNDCESGLFGLQKGSRSPIIQFAAVEIAKACIVGGAFPYFLHVSGKRLIEEGLDDGSRAHAEVLRGPACGKRLRGRILNFAQRLGLTLTVDFFASACNAVTPRFMSWTEEPTSERADAFSAKSWDVSRCPHCGRHHRELGFFFPPSNLEDSVVRRARSDGARGIFLVPNSAKQGYWQCLTRDARARHLGIAVANDFVHASHKRMTEHSLFYVDFGEGADDHAPPCAQALLPRPGLPRLEPKEEEELQRLRQEAAHLAVSLREPVSQGQPRRRRRSDGRRA